MKANSQVHNVSRVVIRDCCKPLSLERSSSKSCFSHLCSILSLLKLLLSLAELGQVEGSNLLGLLNLLLVGLDLLLELGGKFGHSVLVLLVLINLELELLAASLGLLGSLHVLSGVGLGVAELNLQLSDSGLQLGQGSTSSTHGGIVGLGTLVLQFSKLGLQRPLGLGQGASVVLLRSELISESGSINHGLLGLLFRVLGLVQHVVNLGVEGVDCAPDAALLSRGSGVDGGHLVDSISGLAKLSLGLSLAPLSRVKEGPGLF